MSAGAWIVCSKVASNFYQRRNAFQCDNSAAIFKRAPLRSANNSNQNKTNNCVDLNFYPRGTGEKFPPVFRRRKFRLHWSVRQKCAPPPITVEIFYRLQTSLHKKSRIDSWCAPCYTAKMIKSFKHKGLKLFFEKGEHSGVQAKHKKRLRLQLSALDTAQVIEDMDLPGYRLHKLKGDRKDLWSITVNGNWRITFEFTDGDVYIVNYEDYH